MKIAFGRRLSTQRSGKTLYSQFLAIAARYGDLAAVE